jgi:hypothetical protein
MKIWDYTNKNIITCEENEKIKKGNECKKAD